MKQPYQESETYGKHRAILQGLSTREVEAQRARGKGARLPPVTGRTYAQILREDGFTLINMILFALCIALLLLGQFSEALVSAGTVLFTVVVSVVQEVRAKRALDRIALLTRPRATVMRNGQEQALDPGDLVQGDLLVLRSGNQVLVDGPIVSDGQVEIDESLLTGESEPITKKKGDRLSSGSFCLSGSVCYRAEQVGRESLAGQWTSRARAFRRTLTPLQRQITVVIQALLLVALYIETVLLLIALATHTAVVDVVRRSVIVVGIVPIGLVLATSVAYALGAFRLAGQRVLVQRLSAVESLSNVDVLCLDKTGTITTNTLILEHLQPVQRSEAHLRHLLGLYVSKASSRNATCLAIEAACPYQDSIPPMQVREEVAFTSERKWSAVALDDPRSPGDHPQTVATLARQVGIPETEQVVTGAELEQMDEGHWSQAARETTIFARITPHQKERLVRTLREGHQYVAMIGDGVNDLLSLKQADLGIAMESGSQATRGVADMVLLNDSFAALPAAVAEGQRIRNGMENVLKLFLTRVLYLAFLLVTIPMVGAFPFAPKQKALVTLTTLSIMAVALAVWAHPGPPSRRGVGHLLLHFALPAAITVSLGAFGVYVLAFFEALQETGMSQGEAQLVAQSALTTFAVCSGLLLVPFVVPPAKWWVGGSKHSGDWRPTLLAASLLLLYLVVIAIPPLRAFFSLAALHPIDYLVIGGVALLWSFIQRWLWRARVLERVLHLNRDKDLLS